MSGPSASDLLRARKESLPPPMERPFRPWGYEVSHSMLLLRSPKEESESGTRVDVLFKGVRAMLLAHAYPRLSISLASEEQQKRIEQLGFATGVAAPAYVLSDEPFSFVQAPALVVWREDRGEFDELSILGVVRPPGALD